MALTPGDYITAIRSGIRERSFSAVTVSLAMTRRADQNMRALGIHPDTPRQEPKPPRMWVPLSDERQKQQPAQTDRQTRQAATTAFVQRMIDDERKIQDPRQREMALAHKHEEGQRPQRQMRQ